MKESKVLHEKNDCIYIFKPASYLQITPRYGGCIPLQRKAKEEFDFQHGNPSNPLMQIIFAHPITNIVKNNNDIQ